MHITSASEKERDHFRIALVFLFLAGLAGALLRLAFIKELPGLEFRNILHSHSHTAIIGWGYLGIFTILMYYHQEELGRPKFFTYLFRANILAAAGMFVTFPFYGYQGPPLFFSTLHLILSYFFSYFLLQRKDQTVSGHFLRMAVYFHILSTLALWLLPVIILNGGRSGEVYHMGVQFYLHFQFNGWFIFSLLALFFKMVEKREEIKWNKPVRNFYSLLVLATLLTYALAVTWTKPYLGIFLVNSVGVAIQLLCLFFFIGILRRIKLPATNSWSIIFLRISFWSFCLKIIFQGMVILPYFASISYTIRNFVIGFLHLILLGMLTFFLLAAAIEYQWLAVAKKAVRWSLTLFVLGFLGTESLLFLQGLLLWAEKGFMSGYYEILFIISLLLPLGIFGIVLTWGRGQRTEGIEQKA